MHVLLVSPYFIDSYANNLSMGSAVKLAFNLSRVMKVTVLTSGRKKRVEEFSRGLKVISVKGYLIPDPVNYMISWRLLLEFWRLLSSLKPDVVLVSKYMFFSSLVIPLAKIRRVRVITITDTFPGINWFPVSKITAAIMWIYARILGLPLLWISDKVIVLYQDLEKTARRYRLNYVVIRNGIESKFFDKLEKPNDLMKKPGEFWVGFVGRPESVKGFDQFLALANKMKKDSDIKFVIAGGRGAPRTEDNTKYLGFRKDMMNIYQLLDVLVLPSFSEGLPNVVMEAMAQEVLVIANKVGGVLELIDDGKNGYLTEIGDIDRTKKLILDIKKNNEDYQEVRNAARDKIFRLFNWDKILPEYISQITNLAHSK